MENIFDLLVGKKMMVKTDMKVDVELEIKQVEQNVHTRQITPDTRENDWRGETSTSYSYTVYFTNGSNKNFSSIHDIKVI